MLKRQEKRMLREEKEDNLITSLSKNDFNMVGLVSEAITPVIFMGEEKYSDTQPYVEPLMNFFANNMRIMSDEESLSKLSRSSLSNLGYQNEQLLINQIQYYIQQHSFLCFCSYLNNIGMNEYGLLNIIPIRETVYQYIVDYFPILYNLLGKISVHKDNNNKEIDDMMQYSCYLAKQISNQICAKICQGVDDSVNYTLLMKQKQNVEMLINGSAKATMYELAKEVICKQFEDELKYSMNWNSKTDLRKDPNFDIVAASVVKKAIVEQLPILIIQQIEPAICKVLQQFIPLSGFHVFKDYKKLNYPDNHKKSYEDDCCEF